MEIFLNKQKRLYENGSIQKSVIKKNSRKTERNKPLLLFKGFSYTIDKATNGKTYWKCEHVRTIKCKGRVHILIILTQ